MTFTNYGKQLTAIRLGSNIDFIQSFGIGTGSATALAADLILVTEAAKFMQTGSPNYLTAQKVTFRGDRNSVQMSGLSLTEFGLFQSGASSTGSLWAREAFAGITFDGTNELALIFSVQVL